MPNPFIRSICSALAHVRGEQDGGFLLRETIGREEYSDGGTAMAGGIGQGDSWREHFVSGGRRTGRNELCKGQVVEDVPRRGNSLWQVQELKEWLSLAGVWSTGS